MHRPRDQFFKTSKLQAGDRSRLNKCQKHFQDIMMELTHVNKVINDGQKCDIKIDSLPCLAEQEPVISNTPPDFLTETTSLGDQAKFPLLHNLFPGKQEVPTYKFWLYFERCYHY